MVLHDGRMVDADRAAILDAVDSIARFLTRALSDQVLGFLALLSLFLLLAPVAFSLSQDATSPLAPIENAIVLAFALEYVAALWLSSGKRSFVLNRWRIVDALIIASALLAMLPVGPDVLRHSPVLRLFRFGRLALLGSRSAVVLKSVDIVTDTITPGTAPDLRVLSLGASGTEFEPISWEGGLERVRSDEADWLFRGGPQPRTHRPREAGRCSTGRSRRRHTTHGEGDPGAHRRDHAGLHRCDRLPRGDPAAGGVVPGEVEG